MFDIILRLQEKRLTMWEDVLGELRQLSVAEKEELGISKILSDVQIAVRKFVPSDWAENPHIRVSNLTREHLRKALTVFMGTGAYNETGKEYAAPFGYQGTGTVNTLVLALLSMIAEQKQNVIFAMEEPEIAIPPHTQRRIVDSVRKMAAQAIFTSHSPYVLDEFNPDSLLILNRSEGILQAKQATLPPSVKQKAFRQELRTRFCESLLARRVLITEGRTEYDAVPAAARQLHSLDPKRFKTFENLGVAVIDAQTETQIAPLGVYFRSLGKKVFCFSDKQEPSALAAIKDAVDKAYESPEKGFESLILEQTAECALKRYALELVEEERWPSHLADLTPDTDTSLPDLKIALKKFLKKSKGESEAAILLSQCSIEEMPEFLISMIEDIQVCCSNPTIPKPTEAQTVSIESQEDTQESSGSEAAALQEDK